MIDSKKIDHGGFAFPTSEIRSADGTVLDAGYDGMSLRDWFAGQMLPKIGMGWPNLENRELLAKQAYEMADAMLLARQSSKAEPHHPHTAEKVTQGGKE